MRCMHDIGDAVLSTVTLSIRIRRDLREKMRRFQHIDWRYEIERFIEERIREEQLKEVLNTIENVLRGVKPSEEPAWKSIRESRKSR